MPEPRARLRRDSARVVLLDVDGRVLLFENADDVAGRRFWLTPGGGLEEGESLLETATRELREETGYRARPDELFGPVAVARGEWEFRGTPLVGEDWFFGGVVEPFTVDDSGWTELERAFHVSTRWWSPGELDDTDDVVLPLGLAELARRIARGERPARPIELPWLALSPPFG